MDDEEENEDDANKLDNPVLALNFPHCLIFQMGSFKGAGKRSGNGKICVKQNIVGTKTPASGLLGSSGFPRLRAGSVILDTTALAQRPPGDQRRGLD